MGVNTTWAVLIFVTAKPQHPGADCTRCHLLSRAWCHLSLFRKPEQPLGPSCCLELWQQPRGHGGTGSDKTQTGRSRPGCELQRAQLHFGFLHSSRDLLLRGRKNHHSTWAKTPQHWKGAPAQPSCWRCSTTCQSWHPKLQQPVCCRQIEMRKHSGVLATDYWTNRK